MESNSIQSNNSVTTLPLAYFPIKQFSPRFGENIFSVDFKKYERLEDSCWSKYAIYNIQVLRGRSTWMIRRRYSEFVILLNYLLDKYPDIKEPFPILPPKTYLNISEDDTFLNDRIQKLTRFLDELLKTMHIEKLLTDPMLIDFLAFSNYNLEMTSNIHSNKS